MAHRGSGPVFLRINRRGQLGAASISAHSVNLVLKKHLEQLGDDPADFSAARGACRVHYFGAEGRYPGARSDGADVAQILDTLLGYFLDEQQRWGRAAHMI